MYVADDGIVRIFQNDFSRRDDGTAQKGNRMDCESVRNKV